MRCSTEILAASTMRFHFAASDAIFCCSCAGVPESADMPSEANLALPSDELVYLLISSFSDLTTCPGRPAGPIRALQTVASSGTPCSLAVASSGRPENRFAAVTAKALSLPAWTWGVSEVTGAETPATEPLSAPAMAGASPLYGMDWNWAPLLMRRYSTARCPMVPLPGLPMLSGCGEDLLRAMSSARVFALTDGLTAIIRGISPTSAIGVRSFSGSNGMGLYRDLLLASGPEVASPRV